ncbi:hypothetical protein ElyMa_003206400 [Elysia marginata]|uniref:Uncharacterized protein n=1 Tax=Elysia marginata TaxID=1093978 RepID=A0AAV4J019_9GAST|nr:hypothetical protein ElyMa_003206400 [Elysia marginata]
MDPMDPLDHPDLLRLNSNFHRNLIATLSDVGDQLQQIVATSEMLSSSSDTQESLRRGIWETRENYHLALGGVHTFISCLEAQALALDREMEGLLESRDVLLDERDVLIDRGHELNCRLGYNALERKLDESFTDLERFTSEESAKCFRDEAEENVKRTHDLIRLANMRSCQMDRDTFLEMEKITNLYENYESERQPFVQELDLFSDVRRHRITSWFAESLSDEDRERGESVLDYLNLEQRERHMEAQVIKNTLRMYSFNASLNFDRQDNIKRLDELNALQNKVNQMSGANRVLPRAAVAKTNLCCTDSDSYSEGARGDGFVEEIREEARGKTLHRCSRKISLNSDPVTDPELVARLEAALRWEENDGGLTWVDQVEGGAEHMERASITSQNDLMSTVQANETALRTEQAPPLGSSSSTTQAAKGGDSVCGDALGLLADSLDAGEKIEGNDPSNMTEECKLNSRSNHSYLCHIESQPVLPGSAEKHIAGLVRKKHSSRQVGSLTNLNDTQGTSSALLQDCGEERDTRSQGSEPATSTRSAIGGNRSREHVPSGGSGANWDKE